MRNSLKRYLKIHTFSPRSCIHKTPIIGNIFIIKIILQNTLNGDMASVGPREEANEKGHFFGENYRNR